jgi:hypothetical protein
VAEDLECSSSKISRIETAQVTATPRDVRDMLEIYQVRGQQRAELLRVAREARQKGWWQAYRDLPYSAVADLETEASSIRMYSALLVPGLLQTEDYARALLRPSASTWSPPASSTGWSCAWPGSRCWPGRTHRRCRWCSTRPSCTGLSAGVRSCARSCNVWPMPPRCPA